MVLEYQDCSNYYPHATNAPALDLISFSLDFFFKSSLKLRPTHLIFGMQHHLMVLYENCTNYDTWATNAPAPGVL